GINTPNTVVNSGTISGAGNGVGLAAGGTVTNATAGALIEGVQAGVTAAGSANGTNSGGISGGDAGVYFLAGGGLTNFGTIEAHTGRGAVDVRGSAGTITNSGLVSSFLFDGIELDSGGVVSNTGTINGDFGIEVFGSGNIFNLSGGIIEGNGGVY